MITDFFFGLVLSPLNAIPSTLAVDLSGLISAIETVNYWIPLETALICFLAWVVASLILGGISIFLQLF